MIEDKTDFEKVVDFGNLYQAYLKSKSGKGFSKSSLGGESFTAVMWPTLQ